ncbi:MAG: DUF4363 family protein [Ruminococcaceae bacterium]|nr:DUF4363 family protein [Oscillospiraceae bacterium]
MKRIVLCIIIIAVIICFGTFSLIYTSSVTGSITRDLEQLQTDFRDGDFEAARACAERINNRWESFCRLHFLTADNEHSLEVTMTAKRIESLLEREDEEALTECGVMLELVKVYEREQMPSIMNIL